MADLPTTNYGWIKPTINADLNVWGGILNTNLDNQDSTVFAISGVANAAMPKAGGTFTGGVAINNGFVTLSGVGGSNRIINFQTASVQRWAVVGADGTAEPGGGSNAGSNFAIARYTDTGAYVDEPISIQRASGDVSIAHNLIVNGAIVGAGGGVLTSFNGRTTAAAVMTGADVNNAVGFAIQSAAGSAIGTSGGTVPLLNGNLTFSGSVNLTGAASAVTQPPGDSDTSIATTQFVASRGMQSSSQQVLSASQALTQALAGCDIICSGGITLNLPTFQGTFSLLNVGRPFIDPDVYLTYPTGTDFRGVLHAGERVMLSGDGGGFWRLLALSNPQDPRLTGLPINSQSATYLVTPSDYGGCVHFTANATVGFSAGIPLGTCIEISCDAGVTVSFSYTSGTMRTVPANSTANHTMVGPGSAFIEQKKTSEIWLRGDAI